MNALAEIPTRERIMLILMFGSLVASLWGLYSLRSLRTIQPETSQAVTTENVQEVVIGWLNNFSMTFSKNAKPPDDVHFLLRVIGPKGLPIEISRQKTQGGYLVLRTRVSPNPDIIAVMEKWPTARIGLLYDRISLELARIGISYQMYGALEPDKLGQTYAILSTRIPITNELTEARLLRELQHVSDASTVITMTTRIAGAEAAQPAQESPK